jgi:hypothetical protein
MKSKKRNQSQNQKLLVHTYFAPSESSDEFFTELSTPWFVEDKCTRIKLLSCTEEEVIVVTDSNEIFMHHFDNSMFYLLVVVVCI